VSDSLGVDIHGVIPKFSLVDEFSVTCQQLDAFRDYFLQLPEGSTLFAGFYRPTGYRVNCETSSDCGLFVVFAGDPSVCDSSRPGGALGIWLKGGVYDGYWNAGCLQRGGNIAFTKK
jgi:hypothetical protein